MFLASSQASILRKLYALPNFLGENLIPTLPPKKMQKIWQVTGPILLSALSILITFIFVQPVACWLDPTFSLFANRGIGKIGITVLVMWHIFLLLFNCDKKLLYDFWQTNFLFFKKTDWIKPFFLFFIVFSSFHALFLIALYFTGCLIYTPVQINYNLSFAIKMLVGVIATFFLAWTEELIFRGTVYKFFVQALSPITSAVFASLIFMLSHNLSNPLALVTIDWKLGAGLFLLGLLLNLIFILTGKLYTGMGAHAGLVFVKVFLRRIPFVAFLPPEQLSFFIDKDLRQSLCFHLAFILVDIILIIKIIKNQKRNLSNN
ncbi:MAG: hypothetical protein US22_C0018G0006 [candidate division TM6 bacterium GW2011_GWF2_36_6]|nr:MAG: hypothetical protein US22_C0018G0006 [candidate division TM6 bacterium GW2011_GWF2_36_6]